MKNILLPTDFSDNSWNAISYASRLFNNEECTFHLINTYELAIYNTDFGVPNAVDLALLDSVRLASESGLEKITQRIQKEFNNSKHTVLHISSFNTLTGEMEEVHKKVGADFIVMGTKGATGANKILFGSNTVHVLNRAKCPVIAVPEDYDFEIPQEILFPSDYNIEFEKVQLKPIVDFINLYQSKVNILHVLDDEKLTDNQLDNRNVLEKHLEGMNYEIHNEMNENVVEGIEHFQSNSDCKLLVMINNKHSFFENLFFKNKINEIGFDLSIPFLVIPTK